MGRWRGWREGSLPTEPPRPPTPCGTTEPPKTLGVLESALDVASSLRESKKSRGFTRLALERSLIVRHLRIQLMDTRPLHQLQNQLLKSLNSQ